MTRSGWLQVGTGRADYATPELRQLLQRRLRIVELEAARNDAARNGDFHQERGANLMNQGRLIRKDPVEAHPVQQRAITYAAPAPVITEVIAPTYAAPAVTTLPAPITTLPAAPIIETIAPTYAAPMTTMAAPITTMAAPLTTVGAPFVGSTTMAAPITTMAAPMTTVGAPFVGATTMAAPLTTGFGTVGTTYGAAPTIL